MEIEAWCRDGISEENIAAKLGIAWSTFKVYKKQYSALSALVARTRAYVDDVEVVPAYLKRVKGYTETEIKREYIFVEQEDGSTKKVLYKETEQERYIPPDTRAAEFWLTNRQPEKWKRQPEADGGENEYAGGIIEIPAVKESEE